MPSGFRGADYLLTLLSAVALAATLWELGQLESAHRLAEDTVTRMRKVLGDDHPNTLRAAIYFAAVLASLGEHDEAPPLDE